MGRLAGGVIVVEQPPLVEERRIGRVEVLRRHVGAHRPPAEGDDPAAQVADRKHDPVAEAVVGDLHVLARDHEPGLLHHLDAHALAGEMIAQGEALGRRITDAEAHLRVAAQRAPGEVVPRLRPEAALQRGLEELRRHLHDVVKALALHLLFPVLAGELGQGHPRFACEPLDGLGKGQPLGLHEEGEDVPVLSGGEAMVELLLVVHVEARRLLRVERRQPLPLPPRLLQPHALADDRRGRQPGADLFEDLGRVAHEA